MSRSRKIFLVCAFLYLFILLIVSVDISRKTTFPGSKPQMKQRMEDRFKPADSVKNDSIFR